MEVLNLLLSNNITTILMVVLMLYLIYCIQKYKKILLVLGSIVVLGYLVYLAYSNRELFNSNQTLSEQIEKVQEESKDLREQIKFDEGMYKHTLGYSLNNPGNIRNAGKRYVGEVSTDQAFKKFDNMKHGFCAMTELLHSYIRGGHNTISKIINRWAPSSDGNNPERYISSVCKNTGISRDYEFTTEDFRNGKILNVMYFMTKVEQGQVPNIKDLYDGYSIYIKKL